MHTIYLKIQISDKVLSDIKNEPLLASMLDQLPEPGSIIPVDVEKVIGTSGLLTPEFFEIIKNIARGTDNKF